MCVPTVQVGITSITGDFATLNGLMSVFISLLDGTSLSFGTEDISWQTYLLHFLSSFCISIC